MYLLRVSLSFGGSFLDVCFGQPFFEYMSFGAVFWMYPLGGSVLNVCYR